MLAQLDKCCLGIPLRFAGRMDFLCKGDSGDQAGGHITLAVIDSMNLLLIFVRFREHFRVHAGKR
jgi:hypothetical protein